VKFKQTESYLDDRKYASIKLLDWREKLQKKNGKPNHQTVKHSTHSITNSIYTVY